MKAYHGMFKKKDGSIREMRYLSLKELPPEFVASKIKGGGQKHVIAEGMELVWDIDENALRIFNHNTALDKIEEFEYTLP